MTATETSKDSRRREPIASHVYTLPVVREIPRPVADPPGVRTW